MEQMSRSIASCADPAGLSLLKWLATVMKRPQLRLVVASAAVLTLSSGVLSQAAGPRRMISRMWDNRPQMLKPAESPLNPQNWFDGEGEDESPSASTKPESEKRGETGAKETAARDAATKRPESKTWQAPQPIDHLHSERPQLARDPFLNQPLPASAASDMIRAGLASRVVEQNHLRPLRQSTVPGSSASTTAASRAVSSPAANTASGTAASVAHPRPVAPTLPASVAEQPSTAVATVAREVAKPAVRQSPETTSLKSASAGSARASSSKNEFADEFDAEFQKLVKSVMDRSTTPSDPSLAAASAEAHSAAPLLPDSEGGRRDAASVRIEEIRDRSGLTAPDPRPVQPVTASNTPSAPSGAAVPAEVVEFRQFLAEREQRMASGTSVVEKSAGQDASTSRLPTAATKNLPAFEPVTKLSLLNDEPSASEAVTGSIGMASLEIPTPAASQESAIPLPPLEVAPRHEAGSNSIQIIPGMRQSIPQENHSGVMLESPQSSPRRVLSNAPVQVAPENPKFRRMSFEQPISPDDPQTDAYGNGVPPLFIPGTGFAPEIAPPPPADGVEAGQSRFAAPIKPIIDWSEDELSAGPAPAESRSWAVPALCGTGLIAAAALAVQRYRRRRSSLNP